MHLTKGPRRLAPCQFPNGVIALDMTARKILYLSRVYIPYQSLCHTYQTSVNIWSHNFSVSLRFTTDIYIETILHGLERRRRLTVS